MKTFLTILKVAANAALLVANIALIASGSKTTLPFWM
jgi:hypothetical protein